MKIEYLADHPDLVSLIAQYNYDQWGKLYWKDLKEVVDAYTATLHKDKIPLTLIALDEVGHLLGFVSLIAHDVAERQDLSPWLAGLFVLPTYRGKGIGRTLVKKILMEASQLKINRLYLMTGCDGRLDFYSKLGWQLVERTQHQGIDSVIMEYVFSM